jgi:putative transposase
MRKSRLQHPGFLYHVIARGNQKQKVFLEDGDYVRYLKLLGEHLEGRGFRLYSYALMSNHVHLLIEQGGDFPLSRYMHRLQSAYTTFFNHKYRKSGHLFQGRYKSILVDKDSYLTELVKYIHLNPWRAKLETVPGSYPWTSHRQYMGKEKEPLAKVSAERVLKLFSNIKLVAKKLYQKYMMDKIHGDMKGRIYDLRDGRILGGEQFEKDVYEMAGESIPEPTLKLSKNIQEIWEAIKQREGLKKEPEGWVKSRLMAETAYVAKEWAGHTRRAVAEHFKLAPEVLSMGVKRLETRWKSKNGSLEALKKWARRL